MWDCESLAATDKSCSHEGEEISYLTSGEKMGKGWLEEGGKGLLVAFFLLDLKKTRVSRCFAPVKMSEIAPFNHVSLFTFSLLFAFPHVPFCSIQSFLLLLSTYLFTIASST